MRARFPARLNTAQWTAAPLTSRRSASGRSTAAPTPAGAEPVRRIARLSALPALSLVAVPLIAMSALVGCGDEGEPYQPIVPPAGVKANLPAVPSVPKLPIKDGEAYTVWGASYYLRSRVHHADVAGRDIKVTGYIIDTNLDEAPKCAIHATGKQDPEGCEAPIPTFWIADSKDAKKEESLRVLGWASNFAQLYDAVNDYRKRRVSRSKKEPEPLQDAFWGVKIPYPLPGPGAKVTVSGNYSTAFTRATSGTVADPIMGVLTYDDVQYLEEPAELATLPGMRP
jgi:hypothetical protein